LTPRRAETSMRALFAVPAGSLVKRHSTLTLTEQNIMPTSRRNQLVRSELGLLLFFAVEIEVAG